MIVLLKVHMRMTVGSPLGDINQTNQVNLAKNHKIMEHKLSKREVRDSWWRFLKKKQFLITQGGSCLQNLKS